MSSAAGLGGPDKLLATLIAPTPEASPASYAAVIIGSSAALAASVRAILLDAIVAGREPNGVVTLKVDGGVVTVKTGAPVSIGATVTLDVSRNGDQLISRIAIPPPADRPRGPAQPAAPTATPAEFIGPAVAAGDFRRTATPVTATAVVLTPTPTHPASTRAQHGANITVQPCADPAAKPSPPNVPLASSSTVAALPPANPLASPQRGGELVPTAPPIVTAIGTSASAAPSVATQSHVNSARVVTATAPNAQPARVTDLAAPLPGASTDRSQPAAAIEATGIIAKPLPSSALVPGATFAVRVVTPHEEAASAPSPVKGTPLPAIVAGVLPRDRLIVDTPLGRLAVSVPPAFSEAAPGSALPLEWFPETMRLPVQDEDGAASSATGRSWQLSRQVAQILIDAHEPLLRQAAEALIPKPGPKLAQQLMAFIGRGDGDLGQWLGDRLARRLESLGVVDRAALAEGAGTRATDKPVADGEWRHVTVPLFDGQMIRSIEIHARRRRETRGDRARDQSRFVVACEHDELGAIQIDGLMTVGSGKQRLDIVLRSHADMPAEDRIAITTLFADACGAMGLGGEIAFQTLQRFPNFAADLAPAHRDVVA